MKPGAEGPGICSSVFTWRDAADAMTSGQRSAHLSSGNALLPDIFRACGSILRRTLVQRYSIYSETSEHTFPRLSQWRAESADAPPTGLTDTRKPLQMSSSRCIYILISDEILHTLSIRAHGLLICFMSVIVTGGYAEI